MEELDRWREAGKAVGRTLGVIEERRRIIALLEQERDGWSKPTTFSYKNALTNLIQIIGGNK